jgi:hypothetical protein
LIYGRKLAGNVLLYHPNEVTRILEQLVQGIQQALPHNLAGIYPRGSLAYGDFNPATSDLDLLVITWRTVNDPEFTQLSEFHKELAQSPNPYATQIEIAYIDAEAARQFRPKQRYPTLERGESEILKWAEHGQNWILERWTIRAYGKALLGPKPDTLINPISPAEIIRAVCTRLKDWAEWAQDENDPDWQLPKSHKAYVVETMCRACHTLQTGTLASKPQSVQWALDNLPPEWGQLAAQSQTWREDNHVDLSINPTIRRFVLWVAASKECAAQE